MAIKTGIVSVSADVTITPSPGVFVIGRAVQSSDGPHEVQLTFAGSQGVLEMSKLIDALVELRDDLRAKVDA